MASVPSMPVGAVCATGGWRFVFCAGLAMALTACTEQVRAGWFDLDPPGPATVMAEGQSHLGPRAYHAMCAREPMLCAADLRASTAMPGAPATMTEPRWQQVFDLNERLNDAIRPRDDIDIYGVSDYWTEGRSIGDCEDYIIAKKQALMRAGWLADQLLYAVVEGFRLPYHAVLVLRTTDGDYVLDNLTDRIEPWEETGYDFVIRQSAVAPANWTRVSGRATVVLGAKRIVGRPPGSVGSGRSHHAPNLPSVSVVSLIRSCTPGEVSGSPMNKIPNSARTRSIASRFPDRLSGMPSCASKR